jgi:flagellar basal-body rod modification protein FlgD
MSSPISSQNSIWAPIPTASTTAAASKSTGSSELGKDAFLKLMVAQLKYQDPSKPADSSAFLAQTAQFTSVEKLADLAKSQESMLSAQLSATASNLVGREVTYTGLDGKDAVGVVTAASISGSSPTIRIGNTEVPLSSVKEVQAGTTGK